jgi:hypothetical protein
LCQLKAEAFRAHKKENEEGRPAVDPLGMMALTAASLKEKGKTAAEERAILQIPSGRFSFISSIKIYF